MTGWKDPEKKPRAAFIKNRPDLPGPPNHPPTDSVDPPPPSIAGDPDYIVSDEEP